MGFQNVAPSGPPRSDTARSVRSPANSKFENLPHRGWNVEEQLFEVRTPQSTENRLPAISPQPSSAIEATQSAAVQVTAKTAV